MTNLKQIIEENNKLFDDEISALEKAVMTMDGGTALKFVFRCLREKNKQSQLRLIEGFREMVREKSSKYGSNNEIDAVSVDLLSELGSINEIK